MASKAEGVESTQPFGEVAGKSVKGHGAFGFRKEDTDLLAAFDTELKAFLGTPEHIALVEPFGFGADYLPNLTTAELCAAQ
jgi:polar amino acid transport system substrate-binding protein